MNIKNWYTGLSWQAKVCILFTLIIFFLHFYNLTKLQHIPGPIFGGDLYRDRGFVESIVQGYAPWDDGYFLGHLQYYSWGIFSILGYFAKLTRIDVNTVVNFYPLITTLLGILVTYHLGKLIFKDETYGLITSTLYTGTFLIFPSLKSSAFAYLVMIPAFLYYWFKYEKTLQKKDAIFAGSILGLLIYAHGGRFLAITGTFTLTLIITFLIDFYHQRTPTLITNYIKKYYIIAIISLIITATFITPFFITYGNNKPNDVTKYGDTGIQYLGPTWALTTLWKTLFNHWTKWIFGIFALIGAAYLYLNKQDSVISHLLILPLANLLLMQHHLLTKTFLNTWFLPEKLVLLSPFLVLFTIAGIKNIHHLLHNRLSSKTLFVTILIFFFLPIALYNYQGYNNNQWVKYGRQQDAMTTTMYQVGNWLKQNVANNETILSHDETGFALTALSGKKVVISRRTHASYYVDVNERIADAALIMYGNNITLTKELIKKYHIAYFYDDQFLHDTPLLTHPRFANILSNNDINFTITKTRLDPAQPLDKAYLTDVAVIPPQEFSKTFKNITASLYTFGVAGQTISIIYALRIP